MSKNDYDDLGPQEQLFLEYYLVDFIQEKARVKARLNKQDARALMARPDIGEIIADMVRVRRSAISVRQRIVEELQTLAFSDITDVVVNQDGTIAPAEGLSPSVTKAVASYECTTTSRQNENSSSTTRRVKVSYHNKIEAKRLLAQILGMIREKVTVSTEDGRIEFEGQDGLPKNVSVKDLARLLSPDQLKQLECRLVGEEESGNLSIPEGVDAEQERP